MSQRWNLQLVHPPHSLILKFFPSGWFMNCLVGFLCDKDLTLISQRKLCSHTSKDDALQGIGLDSFPLDIKTSRSNSVVKRKDVSVQIKLTSTTNLHNHHLWILDQSSIPWSLRSIHKSSKRWGTGTLRSCFRGNPNPISKPSTRRDSARIFGKS